MLNKDYVRGVKAAASLASQFDSCSSHEYRLEDVINCKLNVVKRLQPRKNKKRAGQQAVVDAAWELGFGLALAEVNRRFKQPSLIAEVARDAGMTIEKFIKAGLDPYDTDELRKCLPKPKKAKKKGARR